MADTPTIYAGTIGQSVWRSKDGGDSWDRASEGIFPEADVRALAVVPSNLSVPSGSECRAVTLKYAPRKC